MKIPREIKFRGKYITTQKWVYGDLIHEEWLGGKAIMIKRKNTEYSILEETVGQFTGLYDKNGKEIYEGDIVSKETFDDTKPDCINISYARVEWVENLASYHLVNKDGKILWNLAFDKYNIEVAGNIYENYDLLKGVEKENE